MDRAEGADLRGMAWVPGGSFLMGSSRTDYPEEGPQHESQVNGFWVDETPVTVAQYRRFVRDTGYVTVAEQPMDPADYPDLDPAVLVPGSLVFTPTVGPIPLDDWRRWWRYVPGADWAHPRGPGSSLAGLDTHPVVHVAYEDASAYAAWAGKDLPTESEWEFAARGGLRGQMYVWGDELMPRGRPMANHWIGEFPWQNLRPAKREFTAPVKSFAPNGFGLFDMTGNVWQWTSDFYRQHQVETESSCCGGVKSSLEAEAASVGSSNEGGAPIPRRVIKGGSHLCADNYCQRYRPASRQAQQVDSSMSHIGFRCIVRTPGPGSVARG